MRFIEAENAEFTAEQLRIAEVSGLRTILYRIVNFFLTGKHRGSKEGMGTGSLAVFEGGRGTSGRGRERRYLAHLRQAGGCQQGDSPEGPYWYLGDLPSMQP